MTITVQRPGIFTELDDVSAQMAAFFEQKERQAAAYGRQYAGLWATLRRSSDGGKRFRPALVVNAYRAFGGIQAEDAIVVATAFELMHEAYLLHDDVIDGDTVRRGSPNVVGTFSARAREQGIPEAAATEWGEASAILGGDLLIHSAQSLVARLDIDHRRRTALLDLLEECMFVTAAGELADVAFSTAVEVPVLSQVISMAQWKTAHYSFQAPLQAGALLAGAEPGVLALLGEYGRNAGIAFQLRDDLLGIYGSAELTGKSTISDLRKGKITPLMCYALQRCDTGELGDILGRADPDEADAARVRDILDSVGARSFIERLIDEHTASALAAIDSPLIPLSLRGRLAEVASRAGERSW